MMGIYDELTKLDDHSPTPGKSDVPEQTERNTASKFTRKVTRPKQPSRDSSSDKPREKSRDKPRDLPTRDEIQEFSFSLRDELKVKVQAEVPHRWQKELETIARSLNVKKLELYRYILGEFLGKVRRGDKLGPKHAKDR